MASHGVDMAIINRVCQYDARDIVAVITVHCDRDTRRLCRQVLNRTVLFWTNELRYSSRSAPPVMLYVGGKFVAAAHSTDAHRARCPMEQAEVASLAPQWDYRLGSAFYASTGFVVPQVRFDTRTRSRKV
jgi:hypothetical protein